MCACWSLGRQISLLLAAQRCHVGMFYVVDVRPGDAFKETSRRGQDKQREQWATKK